jgi:hypothetical protein
MIMAVKGEKGLIPGIMAPSPSISSVVTDLDHLSVSSLSILNGGMFHSMI